MEQCASDSLCSRLSPELHGVDDCAEDQKLRTQSALDSDTTANDFCSIPLLLPFASSIPSTSPRMSLEDICTQDTEPVPYSSTPDLASSQASSSPNSAYDSQLTVTPPEEHFARTLHRKLRALINPKSVHEGKYRTRRASGAFAQDEDEAISRTSDSEATADEYDTTPSTTSSIYSLKRKRDLRSRNMSFNTEAYTDENNDVKYKYEDKTARHDLPSSKKLKETSFNYETTETASARRAHSLSATSSHGSIESLIPTELASPSRSSTPVYKAPSVPIIAPPAFDNIPRCPLSLDDVAEGRLKTLLQKEEKHRKREGFEEGVNFIFDSSITKEQVDEFLGISEEFRMEVIAWMLRITPSRKLGVGELRNQLRTCPETRFHAVLLFTRYFMRVGDAMPVASERETPLMRLGRKRITWDVAVSCLALAVKFNRDFLYPLIPIYSREFLVLAPHPMSHDDFEISQKDVLQALDYEIRDVTPEPFMQEIWNSLPTFRKLLSYPSGWEATQMNAWQILNTAATTTEMVQFPMSLLTAVALIEGATASLIDLYDHNAGGPEIGGETAQEQAVAIISDTVKDIKELLNISSSDLRSCRRWMRKIIQAIH